MPKCDGYESRKKIKDGTRSNPKYYKMDVQQPISE